ncbi:MAG: response regulator transcription factor [Acidobacteriota bacterium]|nr:response regulator transcription factor [Acidobacteriota bacterium]
MNKILVVDDDTEMTDLLASYLTGEGYQVLVAGDGATTLAITAAQEPDLVLLDIVLGEEDGRDVLRELRLISDVPVIFLTGRGLEAERIAGLKLGADDYIVKPFSLGEVSARVETVLRRSGVNLAQHEIDAPTMRFGDLLINETTHEVHLGGRLIELTSKEFALLAFLAHSPRQVFTREQLLEQVWESSSEWQNEATVTEHVRRLRSKIETDPDHPRWILTVRGVGYRFESEPAA